VVPEELSAFAKKHKVSLLTHSDPQVHAYLLPHLTQVLV